MLVVKTGSTLPPILSARGDFERWIAEGMGLRSDEMDVCSVVEGETLPAVDAPRGVVVTGSPAMVSARAPWSEATAAWLVEAVEAETPVLGICYGHQLLAHGLGAEVGPNPKGREMGTVELEFAPEAERDVLLGGIGPRMPIHTTHVEAVLSLPDGAELLAHSDLDPFSSFRVGACAWGVQFHPEFDAEIMRGYVEARYEILEAEGHDPAAIRDAVRDAPAAWGLLARLAEIARTHRDGGAR